MQKIVIELLEKEHDKSTEISVAAHNMSHYEAIGLLTVAIDMVKGGLHDRHQS